MALECMSCSVMQDFVGGISSDEDDGGDCAEDSQGISRLDSFHAGNSSVSKVFFMFSSDTKTGHH